MTHLLILICILVSLSSSLQGSFLGVFHFGNSSNTFGFYQKNTSYNYSLDKNDSNSYSVSYLFPLNYFIKGLYIGPYFSYNNNDFLQTYTISETKKTNISYNLYNSAGLHIIYSFFKKSGDEFYIGAKLEVGGMNINMETHYNTVEKHERIVISNDIYKEGNVLDKNFFENIHKNCNFSYSSNAQYVFDHALQKYIILSGYISCSSSQSFIIDKNIKNIKDKNISKTLFSFSPHVGLKKEIIEKLSIGVSVGLVYFNSVYLDVKYENIDINLKNHSYSTYLEYFFIYSLS